MCNIKIFLRFHSSYKGVFGGLAGDAFVTLTGGVAENIKHDEDIDKPTDFFNRVSNALRGGSLVSSSVPVSLNYLYSHYIMSSP